MHSVRARTSADLVDCVAALAEVHASDGYPMSWPDDPAAWLAPAGLVGAWVAVDGDRVDAHVAVTLDADAGHRAASVSRLFVRPAARGSRLGATLLDVVSGYAAERRLTLTLEVVDEPGSAAIALYERLGWTHIADREAEWRTPAGDHPTVRIYRAPCS